MMVRNVLCCIVYCSCAEAHSYEYTLNDSKTLERLEAVQRRALKIIFCYSSSTSYLTTLELVGILSLQARRMDLSQRSFRNICKPDSCLHHLLPHLRDLAVTSRLRKPTIQDQVSEQKDTAQQCLMLF